jgi:hypothetical protein
MNPAPGESWTPSRELLAAFADGELEDRPHLAGLLRKIEAWLADHPEAFGDLEAQVELTRLMAGTAPPMPTSATWANVWSRVEKAPRTVGARWKSLALGALVTASAAAVVLAVLQLGSSEQPAATTPGPSNDPERLAKAPQRPEPIQVLEVATADEVEIVRVAGGDTHSLINVRVPVNRPLELLAQHEVELQPPANNPAGTEILQVGSAPMFVTPLPREREEEDKEQ